MNHHQDFWEEEHKKGTYFQMTDSVGSHASDVVVDYVDRFKGRYGKFKHEESREYLTQAGLIDYANIETEGSDWNVLEIGCGYGHVGCHIAPFVKQYDGTDISSRIVDDGNAAIDECNILNMRLHHTPDSDLSQLSDNSYDLIVTCAVFIHTAKSVARHYLRETRRLLKDTGIFSHHVNVTSGPSHAASSIMHNNIERYVKVEDCDDVNVVNPGMICYNTNDIGQMFRNAGLDVRRNVDRPEFEPNKWARQHVGKPSDLVSVSDFAVDLT